jgi:hypothetical protein
MDLSVDYYTDRLYRPGQSAGLAPISTRRLSCRGGVGSFLPAAVVALTGTRFAVAANLAEEGTPVVNGRSEERVEEQLFQTVRPSSAAKVHRTRRGVAEEAGLQRKVTISRLPAVPPSEQTAVSSAWSS